MARRRLVPQLPVPDALPNIRLVRLPTYHEFIVDRPFFESQGEDTPPKYANITRLQVYGAPEIKAVRVSVEPKTPWVFSFSPLHN